VNPVEEKVLAALDQLVRSRQPASDLVKRMPGVVPQLMQALRTGNFSGADISQKIAHDVVLVQAVLRAANSSLYSTDQAITSIEHAVLIIGQENLRQLIASVAFRPIINFQSGRFVKAVAPAIWSQSELCAAACRVLAPDHGVEPFEAFLSGLAQNIGLMASLSITDKIAPGGDTLGSAGFVSSLLRHARTLTCNIGREWDFPQAVVRAIEEQQEFGGEEGASPAGRVLLLGDYLSKARILVTNRSLGEDEPWAWQGLSGCAMACYQELGNLKAQEVPGAE
jgi:HD-like signal output (HDOD) protein